MQNKIKPLFRAIKYIKNWPDYLFDYFGLIKSKKLIYYDRRNMAFIVRPGTADRGIMTSLTLMDEHHLSLMKFPKDAVVIEIGAQIGFLTIPVAKKAKRVYAYEPVPENFEMLNKNVNLNNLQDKIFTRKVAIGSKNGEITIYISDKNTGGHSIYKKGSKKITVPMITLKKIFENEHLKKCFFMKIDVEGAEYEILYNTPKSILNKIENLYVEYHPVKKLGFDGKNLSEYLRKNGFSVKTSGGYIYAKKNNES